MVMPLEGIKVVELAAHVAGPAAATVLAYYGAEVVKIEQPGVGDPLRAIDELRMLPIGNYNHGFELIGCNKRSIGINLTQKRGQELAHRLIERADVFVTNILEPTLKRFNLEYETACQLNPRLIYAYSTAYGDKGPDADMRGFDLAVQLRSGIALRMTEIDSTPPTTPFGFLDVTCGTYTAFGVCLALRARELTGKGQKVSNSLFGTCIWSACLDTQAAASTGQDTSYRAHKNSFNPFFNYYHTKDGVWIWLQTMPQDIAWAGLCEVGGFPELIRDPRFDTAIHRGEHNAESVAILDKLFASKTFEEWQRIFEERDFVWMKAQTFKEVVNDPQMEPNEYLITFPHPTLGEIKLVAPCLKFSQTPGSVRTPAPELGQNTEEILEELGYSWDEILSLKDAGVIT